MKSGREAGRGLSLADCFQKTATDLICTRRHHSLPVFVDGAFCPFLELHRARTPCNPQHDNAQGRASKELHHESGILRSFVLLHHLAGSFADTFLWPRSLVVSEIGNSNATQPASNAGCSRASRVAWPTTRLSSLRPISFRREGMGLSWQGRGTETEGAAGATKQQNDGASTRQQESQRAKTLKKQARERSIRRKGSGAGPGGGRPGEKKRGKKTSRIEQKTSQKKCTGK